MNEKMNREKICKALSRLSEAMGELNALWDEAQTSGSWDVHDILNEQSPFDRSFDELTMDVLSWAEYAIGKIENL